MIELNGFKSATGARSCSEFPIDTRIITSKKPITSQDIYSSCRRTKAAKAALTLEDL
jgi:hypothetical protein